MHYMGARTETAPSPIVMVKITKKITFSQSSLLALNARATICARQSTFLTKEMSIQISKEHTEQKIKAIRHVEMICASKT